MGRNNSSNVTGTGSEDSLKSGWLTKRSQLKTRFAAFATNYKDRWFILTRTALIYHDSQDPSRRKERGRLPLKEIKLVEKVSLKDREEPSGAFQIGYAQNNGNHQDASMCIIAKSDVERDEWIALIRNLIRSNNSLSDKYHPCQWSAGRWICCGDANRNQVGCEPITWTPRQSKSDPVPPLPASVIVAAEAVAAAAARSGADPANVVVNNAESVLNALTAAAAVGPAGLLFDFFFLIVNKIVQDLDTSFLVLLLFTNYYLDT